MRFPATQIRKGHVVWGNVPGVRPNHNPRFSLALRPAFEWGGKHFIPCAGIKSTGIPHVLPYYLIELPSGTRQAPHPVTALFRESYADASWKPFNLPIDGDCEVMGEVTPEKMDEVVGALKRYKQEKEQQEREQNE